MNKWFSELTLVLLFLLAFSACGQKSLSANSNSNPTTNSNIPTKISSDAK